MISTKVRENPNFTSLPPFALYNPKLELQTINNEQRGNSMLLGIQREKLSKVFYEGEKRMPYMNDNLDLAFPDL